MRKIFKTILCSGLIALCLQSVSFAAALSDWAVPEYTKAASAGLLTYNVVTKNLKESITREEFCELATALYKKLSKKVPLTNPDNPFLDCDNPAVALAYHYNLVSGTSSSTFEPYRFVTRQEMAKILENVLIASSFDYNDYSSSAKLPLFHDSSLISNWALEAVGMVTRNSIMSGFDGNFNPLGVATREQAILSVYRTLMAFSESDPKTYSLKCTAPAQGEVIENELRINCSTIGKATGYFIIIKDSNGNPVKNVSTAVPTAFRINETTLPHGDDYTLIISAVLSDKTEVFSEPITFSFKDPYVPEDVTPVYPPFEPIENFEIIEPPVIPEIVEPIEEVQPVIPPIEEPAPQPPVYVEPTPVIPEPVPEKPVTVEPQKTEVMTDKASALIKEAEKYLGIPYVYGGTTPDGFDCSGFVKYVFEKFGITLKRVSRDQYAYCGTKVEKKDLQPGDLVFFGTGGVVGHVGIYTGNGMMIHSPSTGKSICYTSIETDYYTSRYIGAKRIF